jgi:Zn-dependent alcohol dehydrogenase
MPSNTAQPGTLAIVAAKGKFKVQAVELKELRSDEVLVKMVATSICHLDIVWAQVRHPDHHFWNAN